MANSTVATAAPGTDWSARLPSVVALLLLIGIAIFGFRDSLWQLAYVEWTAEEYSHCYFIPVIALFLIAVHARELAAVPWRGSKAGVALIVLGYLLLAFSQLSSIYTIADIGFIITLWGCFLAVLGWPATKTIWMALAYLVFMVPMPDFIEYRMSSMLQLWSSQIGVAVIRMADIPVYLSGNVIDLGSYTLQVAEACSGMRYLFPLMSFSFLCAAIFTAPTWQRVLLFLSAAPITVLMNSFRVGVIGILVHHFGIEQAEGFLHDFEGWVVFMACVGVLFSEMYLMARLGGRRLLKSLRLDTPPMAELARIAMTPGVPRSAWVGVAVGVLVVAVAGPLGQRGENIPQRAVLATFPLAVGDWRGVEDSLDAPTLNSLKATDTFLAVYGRDGDAVGVGMWIAYYESQRSGEAVHSPAACLPGGGWLMESLREEEIPGVRADGSNLPVNRALISQGEVRQLVYYWFPQRGRMLTNEYLVKWYVFLDSLLDNRSDGALVRLTTLIEGPDGVAAAEKRLQDFIRAIDGRLNYFLPPRDAAPRVAAETAP